MKLTAIMSLFMMMVFFAGCATQEVKKPATAETRVHGAKNCEACHMPHKREGKILLNKPVSELCSSCHQDRLGKGEHKVGIKPRTAVEGLPLDSEGKMTCVTCHDPHSGKEMFLRASDFNELCKKCHQGY